MSKSKEPRICYYVPATAYYDDSGYRASLVKEGIDGHYPTGDWPNDGTGVRPLFLGHDYDEAEARATKLNRSMGLSDEDVLAIICSSFAAQNLEDKSDE